MPFLSMRCPANFSFLLLLYLYFLHEINIGNQNNLAGTRINLELQELKPGVSLQRGEHCLAELDRVEYLCARETQLSRFLYCKQMF